MNSRVSGSPPEDHVNKEEAVVARSPHPILFALVTLPAGIAQGFLTITLPFIGRGAGLSVSASRLSSPSV